MGKILRGCLLAIIFFLSPAMSKAIVPEKHGLSKESGSKKRSNTSRAKQAKHFANTITTNTGLFGFCPGGNVILIASPGGDTYQWTRDGANIPGANSVNYTANTAGSYNVTVTTANVPVTYTAVDIAAFVAPTASFIHTPDGQCASTPIQFTSTATGNGITYLWDFGDPNSGSSNTSTVSNPNHKFIGNPGTGTQSFTIKLTVTNNTGCSVTTSGSVTIQQRPGTELTGSTKPYNGLQYFVSCSNAPGMLTFGNQSSTKATNTGYRIIWGDGGGDFVQTASWESTTHTYVVGTYKMSYIVTGSNGCKDTTNYNVFIGSNPGVGLGNPGNTSICTGSSLTFPVTGTENNPPGTIYTVTFNDGTPAKTYTTAPDTIIHYFFKSSCGVTSQGYDNSFSATIVASNPCKSTLALVSAIYVSDKPKAAFIATKTSTCVGNTITVTNTGLSNEVNNEGCQPGKFVWSISPATGWTASKNNLGDDLSGNPNADLWKTGIVNLPVLFTSPGTYTIRLRSGSTFCGNDEITQTVCINPTPIASFTTDVSGGCGPLSVKTTNTSPAPLCGVNTYRWTVSPSTGVTFANGTMATSANPELLFASAGTFSLSLTTTSSNGECISNPAAKTITVTVKPTVGAINATANICEGGTLSPTSPVTSTGVTTYQWTFPGGNPSASTSANPGTITYPTAGNYTLTLAVTNECGTTTVTKPLVVTSLPVATVPASLNLCNGDPSGVLTFTSNIAGTTYSWTNNNTAIGLSSSGTGGSIPNFTVKNTGVTTSTATITVTPTANGCPGTPATFNIVVNPKPVAPAATALINYCLNEIPAPLAATPASGNTLHWYTNSALTGGTTTAPTPSTTTAGTFNYYVTQSNAAGCESPATTITIIVNPAISNNTIGSDQNTCSGTAPAPLTSTATLSGGSGTFAYQWQRSTDGGTTWANITNATSASYSPGALTSTTQYRRVVNSAACSTTSNTVVITVQGSLANFDISSSQNICGGGTPVLLTGQTPVGGTGVFTFQWESSLNNTTWTAINGASGNDYQPGALTATTFYRRRVVSNICSSVSSVVTITVNPTATMSPIPDRVACNGSAISAINFSSSPAGNTTFAWVNDNTASGLSASGNGNISSFTGINNAKAPITSNITVTPIYTAGGSACNGVPTTFSIIILPTIGISPKPDAQYCAGDLVPAFAPVNDAVVVTGGTVSYTWTVTGNIGMAAGNGSQVPAFTAINTGTTNRIGTVSVTPVYTYAGQSCNGQPITYNITINAKTTTAAAGPNDKTCAVTYTLAGNTPVVGIGTWTTTLGPAVTYSSVNSPGAIVSGLQKGNRYQFTWSITNNSCATSTATITLDVLSDITNVIKTDATATCPGQPVTLSTATLTGGDVPGVITASYTYVWESSANGTTGWATIPGQTSAVLTVTPTANTFYRRKVSSYTQCEVISNTVGISLNSTAVAANAGTAINVCNQTGTQLNGNDPGSAFLGTWTDSAPGSTLTFSPDAHTFNATVNGLVPGNTYHLVWSIASASCGSTSSPLTITDYPAIINTISPSTITVCFGQQATIAGAAASGGNGNYQYSWESTKDQLTWTVVAGQTGKDLTFLPSGTVDIRRNVISGSCNLESNIIHVIQLPAIAGNTISADQQVCINKPVAPLTGATPTGGDGTYIYQWQQSTDQITWTNIISAVQPGYQPPLLNEPTYFRRSVSSGLCAGSEGSVSNVIKILVNPNAKAEYTASVLSSCVPFDLKKVITPVPHDDVDATYQWLADGVQIGTGSVFPGYIIKNDGQSVVIKLITVSKFGCDTNSVSKTFSTVKSVTPSFTKDQTKGCGPLLVNFTNTSAPLNSATYLWNFGNGQTSAQVTPSAVTFQPNAFGRDTTYYITLKAITSCGTLTYTDSVKVRAAPQAIFTPDKTVGCSPFLINITNQSRGLPNQYTYDFGNGDRRVLNDNQAIQYTYTTLKTDTLTLKLTAENECGKDSSFYKIVVYPNSVQANLVVNGNNQTGCAPFEVSFFNNSTGANVYNYDFNDGTTAGTTRSPETVVHTFNKPGVYNVKMTASNGCSFASIIKTITVLAQPAVAFKADQLQYCAKEAASFTNTTPSPASFNYIWDFGDGATSNDVNPKHTYAAAGTYPVKLTALQNAAGASCSTPIVHNITILPLPVATFTTNAGNLNCAPFLLSVNTTPANASSVSWDFGDPTGSNNTAAGYTAQHAFTKPGIYRIVMKAYNQTGCVDSTMQIVKVTETPKATFSPGDSVICGNNATIKFKNITTYGGTDLVTYKWFVNNTYVSAQQDLNYTFNTPAGTLPYIFQVKLIAYSTIGCPDTVIHKIQFNPLPIAQFTTSANISCAPFVLNITNLSTYADSYKWYINNVLVSTDKTPVHLTLTQPNQTYTLKLVAANVYGCREDTYTAVINTYPKPKANFTLQDSTSCTGLLAIRVTNTSTGATSYNWNFGDGSAAVSGSVPVHNYGVPGIYELRLIAFNGTCYDTVKHTIQIANPVKAAFTANNLKGCSQAVVTFQNLSVNAATYLWDFGDGTFSTLKNPSHTFTSNTSAYSVKLTAYGDFGCSDEAVQLNYITVVIPPAANFAAFPDSVINVPDHTFNFKNLSTGNAVKYSWSFGDGKTSADINPTHTYLDTGSYKVTLTVTNADGCTGTSVRTVKIAGVPQYLYVPNAFEPGSANSELQTFNVRATGLKTYNLRVFNKWGQLLFQTSKLDVNGSPSQGWDGYMQGKPAPQGVYVWDITAFFLDGTEWRGMKYNDGRSTSKTGIIHLIR